MRKVLILSSSPRKGGNSDRLCDQFIKGAVESGHTTEKIYVHEQNIGFCTACNACSKSGVCVKKDDMGVILEKMITADVIVMATPVYYYTMNAQMKTLIDRTYPRYREIANKDFYFIATAADGKDLMERAIDSLCGFTNCLPGATVKSVIYGAGVGRVGDIQGKKAMQEAYDIGKQI